MTQEEIREALKYTKFRVTSEEESEEIQNLLFSVGYAKACGETEAIIADKPFFLIWGYPTILYLERCYEEDFMDYPFKEITTDYIRNLIKNNMEKEIKITIPQGYEVDKENSTFECIKFKKKQEIKTFKDLTSVSGYYISNVDAKISSINELSVEKYDYSIFLTKKQAKSALAMAYISQLIPYYGGEITDEEWKDPNMDKFILERYFGEISKNMRTVYRLYSFLAFHTKEQRDEFLKNNERLVKDYLMID